MDLEVLSHSKDGTVSVIIGTQKYIYFIDAMWIDILLAKEKKSKGDALNFLKSNSNDFRRIDSNGNI